MKKALAVLFLILLTAAFFTGAGGTALALTSEADFVLDNFELVGKNKYADGVNGCDYEIILNGDCYDKLIRVTYETVKLGTVADSVTVNEKNEITLISGQLKEEGVKTVTKSEVKKKENSEKYYFTVHAQYNCAFVFTVYAYNSENEETAYYGDSYGTDGSGRTNILYCKIIDNSAPVAYAEFDCFDSGKWVFNVTVRGNRLSDVSSADSGLSAFTVRKKVNGTVTDIEEVKNIGSSSYVYILKVGSEKAVYFVDIEDNVGNLGRNTLTEFNGTTDPDIEAAVTNAQNRLKTEKYADFSPDISDRLKKAYDAYYVALQNGEDNKKKEKLRQSCLDILGEINRYENLKAQGLADLTVKNYNKDYFGGAIKALNSACLPVKYGEGAVLTVAVTKLTIGEADGGAVKAAGIKKAESTYAVTLETEVGNTVLAEKCSEKLRLSIPKELSVNSVAVQKVEGDETIYEQCGVTVANGYTEISVDYPSGTVYLFVGTTNNDNLKYLAFLAILPIGGIIAFIAVLVKKRREVMLLQEGGKKTRSKRKNKNKRKKR